MCIFYFFKWLKTFFFNNKIKDKNTIWNFKTFWDICLCPSVSEVSHHLLNHHIWTHPIYNHWYCRWPCLLYVCPLKVELLAWTLLCWLFLQGELSQSLETVFISALAKSLLNSLLQIKSSCFLLDIQQMHQIVSFLPLFSSLSCTDTLKKKPKIVNNCKLVFQLRFYISYSNDVALAYFII